MRGKLRKMLGLLLVNVLVLSSIVSGILPVNAEEAPGAGREIGTNLLSEKNTDFEGGSDEDGNPSGWYASNSAISVSSNAIQGEASMLVKPNEAGHWNGGVLNIGDALQYGTTYEYSFYARLAEEESEGTVALYPAFVPENGSDWGNAERVAADTDDEYIFCSSEWTKVTGTFTMTEEEDCETHLVFTAVDSTTAFYVDDFKVGAITSLVGENIIMDPTFDDTSINLSDAWYANKGDATIARGSNDNETEDVKEMLGGGRGIISDRTQNWNSFGQDITAKVKNNTDYYFSFYARLSEEYGDAKHTVKLGTTKKDSTDTEEKYSVLQCTGGSKEVSAAEWTKIEGVLSVVFSGDLEKLVFKISEEDKALPDESYGSYYVANVQMYEIDTPKKEIEKDIKDLKAALSEKSISKTGVALPVSALADEARMELVTKHYNSVTAENEMKPESFLGQTPSVSSNNEFPVLNFTDADKMMDYLYDYNAANPDKEDIMVRGHVLLWHSQTPKWFFSEDYDTSKGYVDSETMLERLENYIEQVFAHYHGEDSKYEGMIYAWDVVNEAVYDNGTLRTESDWYQVFEDDRFIIEAFKLANKYAPADVKLYYNDYNDTTPSKVEGICNLITKIKNAGGRVDGMGMQAHYDMGAPAVSLIETAVRAYSEVVDEIQFTEIDIKPSNGYDGSDKNAEYQKQAYRYKDIYDKVLELNKEEGININGLIFWGTHDGASWLNDFNAAGGGLGEKIAVCPLLFNDNYKAKPAYWAFVDPSKLEPFVQECIALQTDEFKNISGTVFGAGDASVTFKPAWNESGLFIEAIVEDITPNNSDALTLYVDAGNARSEEAKITVSTIARSQAKAVQNGYSITYEVPISGLKVTDKIGFDFVLTDGSNQFSYNDLTNDQENSSKYYAQLTMKPFAVIGKASVTVDDKVDEIWSKAELIPLSIATGTTKASAAAKLLWDDNYLYALIKVEDSCLNKEHKDAHEQDSVEVFIDENNHKTDAYEADDKQYRMNYNNDHSFNGLKCTEDHMISKAVITNDGYYVEAAFKWTDITPKKGDLVGLELQVNDASESNRRIGTLSWYDESGNGWSSPKVFGTVKLGDVVKQDQAEVKSYNVTVANGQGSGSYKAGATVTIKANAAASGKVFDKWTVEKNAVKLADETKETTSFTMPEKDVKVTALYKDAAPKKGTVLKDSSNKAKYKVVNPGSAAKKGSVEYTAPIKKTTKSVKIPSTIKVNGITYKVTSIAKNAFKGNKKVQSVTIGSNVTTIGDGAFKNCSALTKVTIPASVIKIGKEAFYNCKKLKTVTIKTTKLTKKTVGKNAFKKAGSSNYKRLTVKVPKKKRKAYQSMLKARGLSNKAKVK